MKPLASIKLYFPIYLRISTHGHLTRLDLAIDDLGAQYYTLASLDDKLSNKAYVSKFRKWKKLVEFENGKDITGYTIYMGSRIRVCLKIHSRHLHTPLRGIFGPNSVSVAHYAPFIGAKSPTKCGAHLPESNFQTHSSSLMLHVYDKQLEQNKKLEKVEKPLITDSWVRWELELKEGCSVNAAELLIQGKSIHEPIETSGSL